jgi:hypothetical protein
VSDADVSRLMSCHVTPQHTHTHTHTHMVSCVQIRSCSRQRQVTQRFALPNCVNKFHSSATFTSGTEVWADTQHNANHTSSLKQPGDKFKPKELQNYFFFYVQLKITSHGTVFFQKLTFPQLIDNFPAFYGICRFVIALTTAGHLPLSWAI